MALLLAMYQKMRLIREKNQLVLDQTKFSSKLTRIEKNITNQQKRYTSLFSQLESQAKMMQNNAAMYFQNMMGLGVNSVNPMNYSGLNAFVMGSMASLLAKGITFNKGKDSESFVQIDNPMFEEMMNVYMANGGQFPKKVDPNDDTKYLDEYEDYTKEQVAAFTQAMRMGQMQQQQAQMFVQNANQQYANNVSIWLEAEKARLEAEQDAVLEPLQHEQTMLELDKTLTDQRLARINEEINSYTELCKQETQNSAPTFGLR